VLVVDDNEINQHVTAGMLRRLGYEVGVACSGRDALTQLEQADKPYDLILMDCFMPEMDGPTCAREIRKRHRNFKHRVPIVALSGNANHEAEQECLQAGMDDYLTKPTTLAALEKTLSKWRQEKKQSE